MKSTFKRAAAASLGILAFSAAPSVQALSLEIATPNSISVVNDGTNDEYVDVNYIEASFGDGGVHTDSNFGLGIVTGNNATAGILDLYVVLNTFGGYSGGTVFSTLTDTVFLSGNTKFVSALGSFPGASYEMSAKVVQGGSEWNIFTGLTSAGNYEFTVPSLPAGNYDLVIEGSATVGSDVFAMLNFPVEYSAVPDGGATLCLFALSSLGLAAFLRKRN